ncbi:DNA-binding protein [Spirillospora sp. NPDC047279]|uniref:DNA-binding protein n=1 Tax=Spirillospora sp. NPDC047279 TaxID=3155478 RepID=UPI0033CAC787
MNTEPWDFAEGVASHLGVAKDSVCWWIEPQVLPAHEIGHLRKFKLSQVGKWVRAGGVDEPDAGANGRSTR